MLKPITILSLFFVLWCPDLKARDISFYELKYQAESVAIEEGMLRLRGDDPLFIITVEAPAEQNNLLSVTFKRKNKKNFLDVIFQFYGKENRLLKGFDTYFFAPQNDFMTRQFSLDSKPNYKGKISTLIVKFAGKDDEVVVKKITLEAINAQNYLWARLIELLDYQFFQRRSINLLTGPTWGGVYINKPIVMILSGISLVCLFFYFAIRNRIFRKKVLWFVASLFVFFWLFLDLLHTVNQIRLYRQMTSVDNVMDNSLSYGEINNFIEFIKKNIKAGRTGIFMAPDPYSFEARYHMYPYVKFDSKKIPDYFFLYYGTINYDFNYPVFNQKTKELKYNDDIFKIRRVIPDLKEHVVIYQVDK